MALKFLNQEQESAQSIAQEHKPAIHTEELSEQDKIINELIAIDQTMQMLKVKQLTERREELRKALLATEPDADPNQPLTFSTDQGIVQFSACPQTSVLTDKKGLVKLLGIEQYIEASSMTMTDIKKYVSENELMTITEKQPGSRKLTSIIPS